MMRLAAGAGVATAVLVFVAGVAVAAPTLDDQVYAIASELMCPVCAGQTVAESNSQLAQQMRAIIRERLQQGQTREQIIAYFISQFGESVLAAPPRRGGGLLIWLAPPVTLAVGIFVLRRYIRRHRPAARSVPPPPTPQEAEQIARDLRELD
ncbi:MAG: cytochrome c-type biogenesis protein CcmH [Armatimonadetes bacterium]|nr:cytochrome c-type biogenesis protein CcmH [Armatimonadota bacterium]